MPARWAARFALFFAVTAVAVAVQRPVYGQGAMEKVKVTYVDRKDGKVYSQREYDLKKESASGLEVMVVKDLKFIPSADIIRVDYTVPGITADQIAAAMKEEAEEPAKAAKRYGDLQKTPGIPPRAKRYLEYREAVSTAKIADSKTGEEFKAEAQKAIKLLGNFAKNDSWEAWAATRQAARYQMELDDFKGAADTLGALAGNKALSKDLATEALIAQGAAMLRAGDVGGAASVAKDAKAAATGTLKQRAEALELAAKIAKGSEGTSKPKEAMDLEKALLTTITDPMARALGYGLLGHVYKTYGLKRDAMWAYLWVDVVNNQDRDEELLAVKNLADIFGDVGEADRAVQYKEKLPKVR